MGQNNAMIAPELKRAAHQVDKVRLEQTRQATREQLAGPVRL
jgi:hypothetical protein